MYSSFASMTNSSIIFWFTLIMLIAVPIGMAIVGIRGIRKDNPNDQRAGRAMLGLAGLVALIAVGAIVYLLFIVSSASGDGETATTTAALITTLLG